MKLMITNKTKITYLNKINQIVNKISITSTINHNNNQNNILMKNMKKFKARLKINQKFIINILSMKKRLNQINIKFK
jgi:hypothetical protein